MIDQHCSLPGRQLMDRLPDAHHFTQLRHRDQFEGLLVRNLEHGLKRGLGVADRLQPPLHAVRQDVGIELPNEDHLGFTPSP